LLPPICLLVISVIADVLMYRGLQGRLREERKRRAEAESSS
jgi:hypothetical protein